MTQIHPTALVDPAANVAADATIGAFTIIGPHVVIGARTMIGSHCVIEGHTTIGEDNRIYSHNAIGGPPQDKKYAGEPTRLEIGHRNTIREFCTINTGTVQDSSCIGLAGHVHVDDWAIIGGQSGVHQFCRVGAHAMMGSNSAVNQDIPPYMLVDGNPGQPRSFNIEGLRRREFSAERMAAIKAMYRLLYRDGLSLEQSLSAMKALAADSPEAEGDIRLMLDFLAASKRGIVR